MEMTFMENEYANAYSQELSTSENITTTEVFEQQTVKEHRDNSMLTSELGPGLDAIVAAVLSQGTASQDATESEIFNDIYALSQGTALEDATESETFNNVYVYQDTEKQFEDLSYVLTEKAPNREEHAASTYQMEEVEVVEAKDYKDESFTMDKSLAANQQLEAEATETKSDYQYSEQQLEPQATETKSGYQYSEHQLEAEATETKSNYQYNEQQLEPQATDTKSGYQYSEQQLEAEATDTKSDYHYIEQQLEAEATETKSDYQYSEQQLEPQATETKSDYQYSEQQLEAEATETKSDYQYNEQQLEAEVTGTKSDYQCSEQQLEAEATETKSDYQYSEQQLEPQATETKSDYQYSEQQLETEATETKYDYQYSEQQLEAETIKMMAEEKPPVGNMLPHTGVEQQNSEMQLLKDNIEKNQPVLPLMAHPRPVLGAGGIKLTLPKDLFDDEFIAETLSGNAEIITGTTLGVNFHKYRRNYDYLKSSSVYQLIHEEESKT